MLDARELNEIVARESAFVDKIQSEVAKVIVWLASDEASYITGALLDIAGGR